VDHRANARSQWRPIPRTERTTRNVTGLQQKLYQLAELLARCSSDARYRPRACHLRSGFAIDTTSVFLEVTISAAGLERISTHRGRGTNDSRSRRPGTTGNHSMPQCRDLINCTSFPQPQATRSWKAMLLRRGEKTRREALGVWCGYAF
jgi:hypothetical protein